MFFDLWKSQFSASWNSLVTDLLCRTPPVLLVGTIVSFKCDVYLRGKSASSNFNAFAFTVSSSGADLGSLSVTKMCCTSFLAQYKSKANFWHLLWYPSLRENSHKNACSSSPTSPHGSRFAYNRTRSCFQFSVYVLFSQHISQFPSLLQSLKYSHLSQNRLN